MKTLYTIRHAKSDWNDHTLDDFQRTLNKRGKRDAPYMGEVLAKQGVHPDIILSSTAVRALTTATMIAGKLGYAEKNIQQEDKLYLADVRTLIDYVSAIDKANTCAIVVSHNPGITDFVNYLTGENVLNMPTCGIARISFPFDDWAMVSVGTGTLIAFEYPKKYFPNSESD